MKWRPWLLRLHRDIGYFFVGLTIIYALSGIAVNHRRHWDYDYARSSVPTSVGLPSDLIGEERISDKNESRLVAELVKQLGRKQEPRLVLWRTPSRLTLFFGEGENDLVDYNPNTGMATQSTRERRFTYWLNRLHLNDHNATWIWFADAFALGLLFLAISGAIMLKGKNGLLGRGWWLMLLGLACPIAILFFG